jgi:hypothetical protein
MNSTLRRTNKKISYNGPLSEEEHIVSKPCPILVTADMTIYTVDSGCRWNSFIKDSFDWTADSTKINASSTYPINGV